MISAEDNLNLNDELSLLNLKEPNFPVSLMSLSSDHSPSKQSSKSSSLISEEKDIIRLRKSMEEDNRKRMTPNSGTLTTAELTTPSSQSNSSTSSLFASDTTDFLAGPNVNKDLFSPTANSANSLQHPKVNINNVSGIRSPAYSLDQAYSSNNQYLPNIASVASTQIYSYNISNPPILTEKQYALPNFNINLDCTNNSRQSACASENSIGIGQSCDRSILSQNKSITSNISTTAYKVYLSSPSANKVVNINNTPNTTLSLPTNMSVRSHNSPYQVTNVLNDDNAKDTIEKVNSTPLFIPNIYSAHQSKATNAISNQTYFMPTVPNQSNFQSDVQNQQLYMPNTNHTSVSSNVQSNVLHSQYEKGNHHRYNQTSISSNQQGRFQLVQGKDGKGIWQWIKNAVNKDWSQVEDIKRQIKHAADSVLTTLDPGMEEYLKAVINIGVSSQDLSTLSGIKNGFTNAVGVAIVKGKHLQPPNIPLLPIGYDAVLNSVDISLNVLNNINFEFSAPYLTMAVQPFLLELIQGRWFVMVCLALKDMEKKIILHAFSQPIALPTECVMHAYNRTPQNEEEEFLGYNISIEEAVKLHIPFTKEQDWCSVLSGISLEHLIRNTAQALSLDHKRFSESSNQLGYHDMNLYNQTSYSSPQNCSSQLHSQYQNGQQFAVPANGF